MWHVGQPVQCIAEANEWWLPDGFPIPKKGEIYTVRTIEEKWGIVLLALEEICNPLASPDGAEDFGYQAQAFRPLTKRNIEIVESLKARPSADLEPLAPIEVAFQ